MMAAVIEVVAAARAQGRDLALVVAVGEAEFVLRQARMVELRLGDIGHGRACRFCSVMAGLVPAIPFRLAQRVHKRDARVKPAHDGDVLGGTEFDITPPPCAAA